MPSESACATDESIDMSIPWPGAPRRLARSPSTSAVPALVADSGSELSEPMAAEFMYSE